MQPLACCSDDRKCPKLPLAPTDFGITTWLLEYGSTGTLWSHNTIRRGIFCMTALPVSIFNISMQSTTGWSHAATYFIYRVLSFHRHSVQPVYCFIISKPKSLQTTNRKHSQRALIHTLRQLIHMNTTGGVTQHVTSNVEILLVLWLQICQKVGNLLFGLNQQVLQVQQNWLVC